MASLDALEAVPQSRRRARAVSSGLEDGVDAGAPAARSRRSRLDDGTGVYRTTPMSVDQARRAGVSLTGESGTGKSTLVRAIAGLWPWGNGEIYIPRKADLFLMPQYPYVPLGNLRRVALYPCYCT